jgi:hypothetical protein
VGGRRAWRGVRRQRAGGGHAGQEGTAAGVEPGVNAGIARKVARHRPG